MAMKTVILKTACFFIAFTFTLSVYGKNYIGESENSSNTGSNTKSISAGCVQASASTELELNNVRALIHTGGDMWWDLQGTARYEIPKGSGKMALFAGGIWIGGVDVNDQLRSCFVRYRANGVDYWPGPLITSGNEQASVTSDVCSQYDRHFVVSRQEVAKFRTYINAKLEGNTEITESEEYDGYTIPKIIMEWPAHGDVAAGYDYHLAPFYDKNYDDVYDPNAGDYPFFDLLGEVDCGTSREYRKPRLYGDQTLWWVYNDKGNVHLESNGTAIGMEIRAQAFAFATNDELNNMTFGNYELINRSTYTLLNTYFGVWTDADMGDAYDDYVGCDVNRGLGYLYNGDEMDGDGNGYTYGAQPPAIGVDFFEGPYQDPDGKDNLQVRDPVTGQLNCTKAPLEEGSINGLNFEDGVVDNERWGMRRFIYYNNGSCNMCDPQTAVQYYNYLQGYWKDGVRLTYGSDGHSGTIFADFMFPGSPNTDVCGWGTGGNPQPDWSEETESTPPGDRRLVQSAGPFTLEPGAVNDITIGMVWARASSGGAWASVAEVQRADDKAQKLFENCFKLVDGPDAPELSIIEYDKKLIFHIYNKKGSNNYTDTPEDYKEKDPFIVCPTDEPDCDVYYRFEGYQVYQLKDEDASIADIYDEEKAKLVFQCDIENYDDNGNPIDRMVNYYWDGEIQASVPQVMVEGENKGIKHTFEITEDKFATGDKSLVNHKKYYYIAIAYAYNNYKKYDQTDENALDGQKYPYLAGRKGSGGEIKSYEAIPHKYEPSNQGTILNSEYGDSPEIVQLEGHGNGMNEIHLTQETIDRIMESGPRWKVDSLVYEKGYGPIDVKIVDPLNVPDAEFVLAFDSTITTNVQKTKLLQAHWRMWKVGEEADTSSWITAENWVSYYNHPNRSSKKYEQLIPEYGISISITQVDFPLDKGGNTADNGGFITATMEFEDNTKPWLDFVPDYDGCSPFDWIKSGKLEEEGCKACNDYDTPVTDEEQDYEKVLDGKWSPYLLAAIDAYRWESGDGPTYCSRKYGIAYDYGHTTLNSRVDQIQNVDLYITSDKSKWTRSPVIEMCEYDTTGGFSASGLSEGGVIKFELRNHPSVDKDGNPDGAVDEDGDPVIGMGWFPGYAINVNTGQRLNIMFGEDSRWVGDNGRDLIWNPSSRLVTDLFMPGAFGDVAVGDIVWGGKHVIYIMGANDKATSTTYMPAYDEGEHIYNTFKQTDPVEPQDSKRKRIFANAMWVGIPYLKEGYELLETDVTIKLRVASPYQVGRYDNEVLNPKNDNNPLYRFSLREFAPKTGDVETAKSALDLIGVVPNPYYGYSEYERFQLEKIVRFTNLPQKCNISIYTIDGTLIRRFEKDNTISYLDWDLKNQYAIDIASGVYIIHFEAPGIGEKVLKWFGSLRPIDLTNF